MHLIWFWSKTSVFKFGASRMLVSITLNLLSAKLIFSKFGQMISSWASVLWTQSHSKISFIWVDVVLCHASCCIVCRNEPMFVRLPTFRPNIWSILRFLNATKSNFKLPGMMLLVPIDEFWSTKNDVDSLIRFWKWENVWNYYKIRR